MVRFIDRDEYSNGKRYAILEFTMAETKEIIDLLVQDTFLYTDIKMTLEQIDSLIKKGEEGKYSKELLDRLYMVREQYAYQRPVTTSP